MQTFGLLLRVLLSLAIVLAVLWLAARGVRSSQRRSVAGVSVDVLARQPLSPKASVAVVRLGGRALVLGVTESRVDLLSEVDLADVLLDTVDSEQDGVQDTPTALPLVRQTVPARGALSGSALSPQTWSRAVEAVRTMTVRR
jgi:flagellar protein FliO/FliZ